MPLTYDVAFQNKKARRQERTGYDPSPQMRITFKCGCEAKFTASSVAEIEMALARAVKHATEERHVLHVTGEIRPRGR